MGSVRIRKYGSGFSSWPSNFWIRLLGIDDLYIGGMIWCVPKMIRYRCRVVTNPNLFLKCCHCHNRLENYGLCSEFPIHPQRAWEMKKLLKNSTNVLQKLPIFWKFQNFWKAAPQWFQTNPRLGKFQTSNTHHRRSHLWTLRNQSMISVEPRMSSGVTEVCKSLK